MYRYIDPSSHNFENCLLPWFSHQSCWGQPLADPSAQAALRGKSWKATIFKILAGRINVSICNEGTYLVLTNNNYIHTLPTCSNANFGSYVPSIMKWPIINNFWIIFLIRPFFSIYYKTDHRKIDIYSVMMPKIRIFDETISWLSILKKLST